MASKSLKVMTSELVQAQKVMSALLEERATVCNPKRYAELTNPDGLIRQQGDLVETLAKRLSARLEVLTGVPARALRGPNLKDLLY